MAKSGGNVIYLSLSPKVWGFRSPSPPGFDALVGVISLVILS
jgi:hypothetical protein